MIDFTNPLRPEIEQIIFPDEQSVIDFILLMDASILQIEVADKDDPHFLDIVQRNIDYIRAGMAYESISQSGVDLTRFTEALSK